MFLKGNIKASSIAEVVIALSVISLCMLIASLVFTRVQTSTLRFQEIRQQTEIQGMLFNLLQNEKLDDEKLEFEDVNLVEEHHNATDSFRVLKFESSNQRLIWMQDWTNKRVVK